MTKAFSRTCNLCGVMMTGGFDCFEQHGADHHPDHYLIRNFYHTEFAEKKYWLPLNQEWFSDRRWLARAVHKLGMTNEEYYVQYGEEHMPEEWQANTTDPALGAARNSNTCLHCGKKVKFDAAKWAYPAFCGFSCSTTWYANNTNRVERAMETLAERKQQDPTFCLNPTQIDYWVVNKGMNIEEAKQKVKERQTTNSLEAFIQRADGDVDEGQRMWMKRQEKWLDSLEKRGWFGNHSAASSRLFDQLKAATRLDLRYGNEEITARLGTRFCKLDCSIPGSKKAIEFFGDYWHANPKKYAENHVIRRMDEGTFITAKEIWSRDETRLTKLRDHGYDVLVVWEQDFTESPEETLRKCQEFLTKPKYSDEMLSNLDHPVAIVAPR